MLSRKAAAQADLVAAETATPSEKKNSIEMLSVEGAVRNELPKA